MRFKADFWIAPILRFYDKFKIENLEKFVKAVDNKFANDWILGYTTTIRMENINKIIQKIEASDKSDDIFNTSVLAISEKELANYFNNQIYGKSYAKYLMLKLDLLYRGHTSKSENHTTLSIEHILPQKPKENSQWKKDFNEEQIEQFGDKLGNLVLISRRKNSSQGNKDYKAKVDNYFVKNIETFSNSVRIINKYKTWTLDDLQENQREVIKKLKEGFGIETDKLK